MDSEQSIKLYDFELSGHCHKVRLFLSLLDISFETININLPEGEHKTDFFLDLNSFGQVPVMRDGDLIIADSNAILIYLALKYDPLSVWLPVNPIKQAQIQRWLSAAAGPLAFGVANLRAARVFKRTADSRAQELSDKLLSSMDLELSKSKFLCTDKNPTIADIAMYSYTAHSPEGGINLAQYENIVSWIKSIESLPRYLGMKRS
ncbi:glutathione S-transferase family protein [Polynucleobacter sp. Adler-ghost]|uniref:glutathione S-transferase family protein n=1 Tax=Polynucleobacter sp. Adler-ghost TaxID=2770234 RepID=UPI0020402903|nr:glutathione S-transferase [Polynucleobacter sp. Adler-ghost]